VMVRTIKGLGTASLILPPPKSYAAYPPTEESLTPGIFDHGSRTRRREVSLVFNAIDSSEGLIRILALLREYGIRATFFVNGEFIRRNPGALKEIAKSGHEVGSMFYANFNLTDTRYLVDAEFITRGLVRNHDDYYKATGKELSSIWHAPYYTVSTEFVEAATSIGYDYIGRDIDPLDWVSNRDGSALPGTYFSANDIVENVMKSKKPGSIIPVRIGIPEGGRDNYFFNEIDLLINGLIGEGYDIVPISTLIEHSR
jgi:peptidoglycan/xylan/chitin deacetylase (PgdA/CDA1 family)